MRPQTAVLQAQSLVIGHGLCAISMPVDLTIEPGQLTALLGVNGAGKSTLLRTLCGLQAPVNGRVLCANQQQLVDLGQLPIAQRAQGIAMMPQLTPAQYGFTVQDWVLMACIASRGMFAAPTAADYERASIVLEQLHIAHLAQRAVNRLSGGQLQLVSLARAIMQQARVILADEPCASLDLVNRTQVMQALKELCTQGIAVVFSTQEPDHALQWSDQTVLFEPQPDGPTRLAVHGTATLTAEHFARVYGHTVQLMQLPQGQQHVVLVR